MNVIKWIVVICLVLAFLDSLCDSLSKGNNVKHRVVDLVIAVVCFIGITVMKMFWW